MNKNLKYATGTAAAFVSAFALFNAAINTYFTELKSNENSHNIDDSDYNTYISVGLFYLGVFMIYLSYFCCYSANNHDYYNTQTALLPLGGEAMEDESLA